MRPSDHKLYEALRAADLPDLAERAKDGEWNDYFGRHAAPQHHLIAQLEKRIPHRRDPETIQGVIQQVLDGAFDGTKAEANEWAESAEGQALFRELMGGT
jgi:hypothetical protein